MLFKKFHINIILSSVLSVLIIYGCGSNNSTDTKTVTLSHNNYTSTKINTTAPIISALTLDIQCLKVLPNESDWKQTYTIPLDSFSFQIPLNKKCTLVLSSFQDSEENIYTPNSDQDKIILNLNETGDAKQTPILKYHNGSNISFLNSSMKNYVLILATTFLPQSIPIDPAAQYTLKNLIIVVDPDSFFKQSPSLLSVNVECPAIAWKRDSIVQSPDIEYPDCSKNEGVCLISGIKCSLVLNYYITTCNIYANTEDKKLIINFDEKGAITSQSSTSANRNASSFDYYCYADHKHPTTKTLVTFNATNVTGHDYKIELKNAVKQE